MDITDIKVFLHIFETRHFQLFQGGHGPLGRCSLFSLTILKVSSSQASKLDFFCFSSSYPPILNAGHMSSEFDNEEIHHIALEIFRAGPSTCEHISTNPKGLLIVSEANTLSPPPKKKERQKTYGGSVLRP